MATHCWLVAERTIGNGQPTGYFTIETSAVAPQDEPTHVVLGPFDTYREAAQSYSAATEHRNGFLAWNETAGKLRAHSNGAASN